MNRSIRALRRVALAAILSVAFLFQGTWALAATTGGIAGIVHDDTGAPIAGATVEAISPSQTATATTDARGHFVFLVLQPDTYTLTVTKDGYQTTSLAGNTVFADQTQQVVLIAPRAIKVIAHVTGTAANLVKPGVSGDIYNVTPAQQAAAAALGGGGNLNSAYSAIAAVPGVFLGTSEMGWDQAVVVHGENPFFTSFEVEGIPVNRAFDNYPSSTESNLGLQELQIYTGGGPSDITSNGVSGFINNVIKTGTYPGYANLTLGTASEAFWHEAELEVGGATPDRNFSYYVGISGYDQQFRFIDNNNGASYVEPGEPYQPIQGAFFTVETPSDKGVYDNCTGTQVGPPMTTGAVGCEMYGWDLFGNVQGINDRENVINLHFGIPRADGQRDDIQALWWDSMMQTLPYQAIDAAGPGYTEGQSYLGFGYVNSFLTGFCENLSGTAGCINSTTGFGQVPYMESYNYNLPFGTNVDPGGVPLKPQFYGMPSVAASAFANGCAGTIYTTGDSCFIPSDDDDYASNYNDVSALKLQWTHPFGDTSYMRIFAYSMYSDWFENDPLAAVTYDIFSPFGLASDYELSTHTVGGSFAYSNQITDTNLVSFEGNIETAGTIRYYNHVEDAYEGGGSEIGLVSESGGAYTCWNPGTMTSMPCYEAGYGSGETSEAMYYGTGTPGVAGFPPVSGAAAAAGAQYETLWNGDAQADYNSVRPLFWNFSLHDQFRPNDKWLFDVALRYDDFTENLANGVGAADNFEAQIIQNDVCWNPTLGVLTYPVLPGEFPPPEVDYTTTCPGGYVHPNGQNGAPLFTDANSTGNQYTTYDWQPRFGFTYTQDPNTVWTFSAGRYAQPALSASDQYLFYGGGSLASQTWADFLNQGFWSPEHEIPNMTSAQYTGSFEHRFRGTDISVKIAPFYTATSNYLQDSLIGESYVTQYPIGRGKNYGVEFSLQDGDFSANGLAAMLSFTYTQSLVQYQPLLGQNQIEQMNTVISAFNKLTKAGGGSECYEDGAAASCAAPVDPSCSTFGGAPCSVIENPYYNDSPQTLLNQNGWYPQGLIGLSAASDENFSDWYNSPYVTALVLNWRHDRFAITPSIQIQSGTPYGSPLDVNGVDPRDCEYNQTVNAVPDANGLYCDYTTAGYGAGPYGYLAVPNPQTGTFASPGEYTEPNIAIANLQVSYDFPHVKLTLTATDLWHTCFGGSSEPWTPAYAPSPYVCAYFPNGLYNGAGWYNGTSPYDKAANYVTPYPWEEESYTPSASDVFNGYLPFNLYLQAQIHI